MKAIFFDFFGVLSTPVYSHFINRHIPETDRAAWITKLNALDLGEISEVGFVKQLSKRTGIPEPSIWQEVDAAAQPNKDLYALIQDELKGKYTLGLLTNATRSLIDRIAAERLKLFDKVIISSDVKLIKPDPHIFELTIRQAGCSPNDILFVDDRQKNVAAAEASGLHGLLYENFATFKGELSDLLSEPSNKNQSS